MGFLFVFCVLIHSAFSLNNCMEEIQNGCVSSTALNFRELSSAKFIENTGDPTLCIRACRLIRPESKLGLIFYYKEEEQTRCHCADKLDKSLLSRAELCNRHCPSNATRMCGGLNPGVNSEKFHVYYSVVCSESVPTTTAPPVVMESTTPTSPVEGISNVHRNISLIVEYLGHEYSYSVVIIILLILILLFFIFSVFWLSLCYLKIKSEPKEPTSSFYRNLDGDKEPIKDGNSPSYGTTNGGFEGDKKKELSRE